MLHQSLNLPEATLFSKEIPKKCEGTAVFAFAKIVVGNVVIFLNTILLSLLCISAEISLVSSVASEK